MGVLKVRDPHGETHLLEVVQPRVMELIRDGHLDGLQIHLG